MKITKKGFEEKLQNLQEFIDIHISTECFDHGYATLQIRDLRKFIDHINFEKDETSYCNCCGVENENGIYIHDTECIHHQPTTDFILGALEDDKLSRKDITKEIYEELRENGIDIYVGHIPSVFIYKVIDEEHGLFYYAPNGNDLTAQQINKMGLSNTGAYAKNFKFNTKEEVLEFLDEGSYIYQIYQYDNYFVVRHYCYDSGNHVYFKGETSQKSNLVKLYKRHIYDIKPLIKETLNDLEQNTDLRVGQAFYNKLLEHIPDIAHKIYNSELDPFFDDSKLPDLINKIWKSYIFTVKNNNYKNWLKAIISAEQ